MRVSVRKGDRGYEDWRQLRDSGKTAHPFLDGVEQPCVSVADEEEGVLVRCVLDDEGNLQIDPDNADQVWEETVWGEVRIEIRDQKEIVPWNGS